MDASAIIFSDLPRTGLMQSNIVQLTGNRSMASVPFGCRYRLIDFSLSSLALAGIRRIGIVSTFGDRDLMDHIGSGKDWDLALRDGGVRFFFSAQGIHHGIATRLSLLKGIRDEIVQENEPYVVLVDGDIVCNVDVADLLSQHRRSGSDITVAVTRAYLSGKRQMTRSRVSFCEDGEGRVTDCFPLIAGQSGEHLIGMHVYVFNRALLLRLIDEAIVHGWIGLHTDLIRNSIGRYRVMLYHYGGYYAKIGSLPEYFSCSMQLAQDEKVRNELFSRPDHPILTRVRNSPPTLYHTNAEVKSSLIADGCEIDGVVENSILFRGVKIRRGATVRNSILLRSCEVGENAVLRCVVSDVGATVNASVSGVESLPFYVGRGARL